MTHNPSKAFQCGQQKKGLEKCVTKNEKFSFSILSLTFFFLQCNFTTLVGLEEAFEIKAEGTLKSRFLAENVKDLLHCFIM